MLIFNGQSSLSFLITAEPVQCSAVRGILVFSNTGSNKQTLTLNILQCNTTITYILNPDLKLRRRTGGHTKVCPGFLDANIKLDDGAKDRARTRSADQKTFSGLR